MARRYRNPAFRIAAITLGVGQLACAQFPLDLSALSFSRADDACPADSGAAETALYRAASEGRNAYYEREVARLSADLEQAEQQIIAIESGLRGAHTRADAVSAIADARISVARAAKRAPWRRAETTRAAEKLGEAERQLGAGHVASAVFFASRAARIAGGVNDEAHEVERHSETRFVLAKRVNLRSGPSTEHPVVEVLTPSTPVFPEGNQGNWALVRTVAGPIGWVHTSLLRER